MSELNSVAIEDHKKMMKEKTMPLLESSSEPTFKFLGEQFKDQVHITMVVEQDGEETLRTTEKVEILNG